MSTKSYPVATISFKKLEVPWLRDAPYWAPKVRCPVHQKEEYISSCPYLAVLQAPAEYPIVITDIGDPRGEPAQLPGWETIWMKGTGGHAHGYVAYARHGTKGKELAEFLKSNPSSTIYRIDDGGGVVTIWSTDLGKWIGRQGRWAKAYQRLGVRVLFKELRAVPEYVLDKCPTEIAESAKRKALFEGRTEVYQGNRFNTLGFDASSEIWEQVKPYANPSDIL